MTIRDDIDCQTWEWVDGDGNVHAIDLTNGIVAGQSQGTGMPPVRRVDVQVPGRPGSFTLHRSYGEKQVALQVVVAGSSPTEVEQNIAAWATRCNVLRGGGALRRTRSDGVTRRVLFCDYDDGLTIDQTAGIWSEGVQQAVLLFYAADPFWYADAATVVNFTPGGGSATGFFPIPNPDTGSMITLVSSEVFGTVVVTNPGDAPAYPVWTLTGPGQSIKLRNLATGTVVDLTADGGLVLGSGEVATIDTRPGHTLLALDDGTNLARYLTDASTLWPIELGGPQTLQVEMSGATAGTSDVELSYTPAHLTA